MKMRGILLLQLLFVSLLIVAAAVGCGVLPNKPTPTPTLPLGIEVYIEAIDPVASEVGTDSGRFHVYTVLPPSVFADGWQKVCFAVGGTAENGVDYEQIQNCVYALVGYPVISLPTDAPAQYIDINPIYDCMTEGNETVQLVLGNGQSAQLVILDGSCVTQTPTPTPSPISTCMPTDAVMNTPIGCVEWFCGTTWVGQCCDLNGNGQYEIAECSNETAWRILTGQISYLDACPSPTPTLTPTPSLQ